MQVSEFYGDPGNVRASFSMTRVINYVPSTNAQHTRENSSFCCITVFNVRMPFLKILSFKGTDIIIKQLMTLIQKSLDAIQEMLTFRDTVSKTLVSMLKRTSKS